MAPGSDGGWRASPACSDPEDSPSSSSGSPASTPERRLWAGLYGAVCAALAANLYDMTTSAMMIDVGMAIVTMSVAFKLRRKR